MKNQLNLTIIAIGGLFFVLACSGVPTPENKTNTPTAAPAANVSTANTTNAKTGDKTAASIAATPTTKITATDLMKAYVANKVKADDLYLNKDLIVSGTVDTIGKGITGSPYVTLKTGEALYSVQIDFVEVEQKKLGDLNKGQKLSVRGKCTGAMGNVTISDGVIQ